MSFIGDEIVNELSKKYKPNSIKTINTNIKRIFVNALGAIKFDKSLLIDRIDDIILYLDSIDKISVKSSMVHNIRSIIGRENMRYNDLVKKYKTEYKKKKEYEIPKGKRKDTYICLKDIRDISNKYRGSVKYSGYIKWVVSALYVYLPPLRGQDFYDTVVYSFGDDVDLDNICLSVKKNFLDIGSWTLVIGYYKTSGLYGIRKLNIPEELKKILVGWFKFMGTGIGDWMLLNTDRKKFKQTAFTSLLWRIFGEGFSVDMLRRVYISEMVTYLNNMDDKEYGLIWRKKLANIVGHSLSSQELIYSTFKFSDVVKSPIKYMNKVFLLLTKSTVF